MPDSSEPRRYVRDAEEHNPWWEQRAGDLDRVTELVARSDLFRFLDRVSEAYYADGGDARVFGVYGQTGIGKTTMLKQFVAAVVDDQLVDYEPGETEAPIVGAVPPSQLLYVPLEASLYNLETTADALAQLEKVVDYFRSRIARGNHPHLLLFDDVGALGGDDEAVWSHLLDLVGPDTLLLATGTTEAQVTVPDRLDGATQVVEPMLPMKFADYLEHAASAAPDADLDGLARTVGDHRWGEGRRIKAVREAFADGSPAEAVDHLDELCFDVFDAAARDRLHDLSREYLRDGGLLYQSADPELVNDLVRSHLLLYLYKELAGARSIKEPENLHRLCAMAATAETEYNYREIAEVLGVDRRTVDAYLDILDTALVLTESTDYALRRHRRTRLFLRDPRHVILLSQRQAHRGFERLEGPIPVNNFEFERTLARTVAFDHALRLAYSTAGLDPETTASPVEYTETEAGLVDYVVRYGETVVPFVLAYHPYPGDPEAVARSFDPREGQHEGPDGEPLALDYEAPVRFVITDGLPTDVQRSGTIRTALDDGTTVCHLPFWLYLLVC